MNIAAQKFEFFRFTAVLNRYVLFALSWVFIIAWSSSLQASSLFNQDYCTTNYCYTVSIQEDTVIWVAITVDDNYFDVPVDADANSVIDGWERVSLYLELEGIEYLVSNYGENDWTGNAPSNLDKFNQALQSGTLRLRKGPHFTSGEMFSHYKGAWVRFMFFSFDGTTVDDVNLLFNHVSVKRPIAGTGNRENGQCHEIYVQDVADLNPFGNIRLITENFISPDGTSILFGQGGFARALVCADTPLVEAIAPLWVLDGRGGKRFLGEVGFEIVEERITGSEVSYGNKSTDFLPCNDYCVATEDRVYYQFSIADDTATFPLAEDMSNATIRYSGGLSGGAFEYEWGGGYSIFDSAGDITIMEDQLTDMIRARANAVTLREIPGREAGNSFEAQGLPRRTDIGITSDDGSRVSDIQIENGYVRFTRLVEGTGSRAENQCAEYPINDYAQGISHHGSMSLIPSDVIAGGTMDLLGFGGENSFYLCSDTPIGRYPIEFQVLDGRGGKTQISLLIEVSEETTPGGAIEWFKNRNEALGQGFAIWDQLNNVKGSPQFSADGLTVTATSFNGDYEQVPAVITTEKVFSGKHYWEMTVSCGHDSLGITAGVATQNPLIPNRPWTWDKGWGIVTDGTWAASDGSLREFPEIGWEETVAGDV